MFSILQRQLQQPLGQCHNYMFSQERSRMFVSSASAPTSPPRRHSPCFLRVRGIVSARDTQTYPAPVVFKILDILKFIISEELM
ncbi:hypothetical protein KC357_g102 [Hortaea werneckii]|nr:hypothetical protein KC357_g102 [Hortaea werneckii]